MNCPHCQSDFTEVESSTKVFDIYFCHNCSGRYLIYHVNLEDLPNAIAYDETLFDGEEID